MEREQGVTTDIRLTGSERVQKLRTMLHAKAKEEPKLRFHALIDKVWREDFLTEAWKQVRRNGGSAGTDGENFEDIELYGVDLWLGELARDLRDGTYAPKPVRQVLIPKKQPGKHRPLGVFSRCKAVLEANDSPMTVKTALQLINRELDEYLGGIQGEFDADTRFAITWFEQNGLTAGDYGTANSIATARGISVDNVKHAGIVESTAGKVRILKRDEIDAGWDPADDTHLTVWECCQHLIRELEQGGEQAAALLLRKIGGGHADAAKDLAYCLYDICANKRQDAGEAAAYNGLIAVWPELTRQAAALHDVRGDGQGALDL